MKDALYYNAVAVAADGDYRTLTELKQKFGTWEHAYAAGLRDVDVNGLHPDPEEEWKKLERTDVRLILLGEKEYPPLLKEIPGSPLGIYVRGNLPELDSLAVAIVGTRRATPQGKEIARRFARELAHYTFVIVSGLAFGIDAAGHEGCLDGNGRTVAVLAGGLNEVYPRENERLAQKILDRGGAIISEYPLGCPPYPSRFLDRNRLISGLSRGVLIVEAPLGSGSLVTARHALEQNRDVFVVPGSIAHPNFAGSHRLIRQGATLVTAPEEILEAYNITREEKIRTAASAASPEEMQVIEALREISTPADVDKIVAMTKLEPHIVSRTLSFLLLKDIIKEKSGGYTM